MFCPNQTYVLDVNGQPKALHDIWYGDELLSGIVKSKKHCLVDDTLYIYRGIRVAGKTPVYENKEWLLVKNSEGAIPLLRNPIVMSVETPKHVIFVSYKGQDYMFGDSFMYGIEPELVNDLMEERN